MAYVDKFSSTSIPPSGASYSAITLAANATFAWSYGYTGLLNIISKIMEISCSAGVVMTMPSAKEVSTGEDFLVRNTGSQTLTINNNAGGAIGTVAAGAVLAVYLKDNTTAAGTWGTVAYGVGTSSVDAATLAGAGMYPIASTLNQKFAVYGAATGFNITSAHRAQLVNYTGGMGTITFTASASLIDGFFTLIRNSGTGTLTLDPNLAELIDGSSILILQPGESAIVGCNGVGLFTVGLGRSTVYQFTQLTKDLTTCGAPSCAANVTTLTSIEAANKLVTFVGSPTVDQSVVVPAVVAVYYVYNNLSTAYSATVKTASGTGAVVPQSSRAILFCDGINVFAAQTVSVTSALSMLSGSVTSPGLYFASETNTGVYRPAVNQFGIAVGGAMSAIFGVSGLITAASGNLVATTLNAALAELQTDVDTRATTAAVTTAVGDHAALAVTHGATGALVGTTNTQTLTNKSLSDSTTFIIDETDATKKLQFQVSGITTATTRTLTVPDASDTIVVLAAVQSLSNKTLVAPALGTPASGVATNLTGTAAGLTAGNVTTNANLTGGVTSVGNAATVVTNANLTGGVTSVGNAATVVTNANLTGVVTSVGNTTAIADTALSIAKTSGLQTALDGKQATDAALTSLAGLVLVAGDTLYATGADALQRLAAGTASQQVRMNATATAPEWFTPASSGVTSVTATAPVVSSGGATPAISIPAASAGANGYMSAAYASKVDGIAAGATVGFPKDAGVEAIGMVAEMTMTVVNASVASGGTIAGSSINYRLFAVAPPGTWRNISAIDAITNTQPYAIFQRIA